MHWVKNRLAALVSAVAVLVCGPAAAAEKTPIGFLTTLTGSLAVVGQELLDGFNLAIKHNGGRLGGVDVELVVGDDQGRPALARQIAERALRTDRMEIVLVAATTPTIAAEAVGPLLDAGRLVISLHEAPPDMAGKRCSPGFFSLAPPVEGIHEVMGAWMHLQGFRRPYVLAVDSPSGRRAVSAFRRGFKAEPAGEVFSRSGQMSFVAEQAKLRQLKPDVIYDAYTGGMQVAYVRQFFDSGLKDDFPLFGPGTSFDQPTISATGEAALDILNSGTWVEDFDNPTSKRMVAEFESEYARPPSSYAAVAYDAGLWLDAALKATQGKIGSRDEFRVALRKADWTSVRGPVRFDANQFILQPIWLRQVAKTPKGRFGNEWRGVLAKDYHDPAATECPMR